MNFTRIGGAVATLALLGCGQAFSDVGGSGAAPGAGGASTTGTASTTATTTQTTSTSSSSPTTGTGGGGAVVGTGVGGAGAGGGGGSTVSASNSSAVSTGVSTGTSSGTLSTTSASTGSGPPPCPPSQPANGSSCPFDSQVCTYGNACCPTTATCTANHWLVATPNCPAPMCPMSPPTDGATCNSCVDGSNCLFDTCSTLDQGTTASCSSDMWQVHHTDTCQGYFACGAKLYCSGTQVCVDDDSQQPPTFTCKSDQCSIGQISCTCDGSLCPGGTTCLAMTGSGRTITCE